SFTPIFEASTEYNKDIVSNVEPIPGSSVKRGTTITLFVSTGPPLVAVPALSGKTVEEARRLISEAGFLTGEEIGEHSDDVDSGIVINQNPRAGLNATAGQKISFTYSLGSDKVQVPSVIGNTRDYAKRQLENVDLLLGTVTERESSREIGTVIEQDPAPSTSLARRSRVNIVISKGEQKTIKQIVNLANYTVGITTDTVAVLISATLETGGAIYYDDVVQKDAVIDFDLFGYTGEKIVYEIRINGQKKDQINITFP
ncbi:MAG: PASTA domain-containing protein, partial [Eubacteriaceae bacterium]|nr:PASTA domain-containing protein [Eubacteriaceae bacterium]